MPSLQKKALSLFIRNGCERQLLLNLYTPAERMIRGLPRAQDNRAGSGYAGEAGIEWQDVVVRQLTSIFGGENVIQDERPRTKRQQPSVPMHTALDRSHPNLFIVEGHYDANTDIFKAAVGFDEIRDRWGDVLGVGNAFPDLLQVMAPMIERPEWERQEEKRKENVRALQVFPDGNTHPLEEQDRRLRLRVIDIKLASEPGAHYFAEVVYYSVTLAAWIMQEGLNDRFVVVAAPAVWPGSYAESHLARKREAFRLEAHTPTPDELAAAMEDDIEVAPVDVFAPRLTLFFRSDLPRVLNTHWENLAWHVYYKCNGCEFLGYPWHGKPSNDSKHCWPTAEREGHLSRVVGLTRSNVKQLKVIAPNVEALSAISPTNSVFSRSSSLRAKRALIPARAKSLQEGTAEVIPDSGGDALMPQWPNLRVFVFLDYDLSSAITVSFALRAYWKEPLPFGSPLTPNQRSWPEHRTSESNGDQEDGEGDDVNARRQGPKFDEISLVDRRHPDREGEELVKFLRALRSILDAVVKADNDDTAEGRRRLPNRPREERSTYQIFLWDEAQRRHLVRIIGRHLSMILADPQLRDLAWLFPPAELLAHHEEASYKSPFTIVSNIIQNTVAVAIPHHYTLLEIAKLYKPDHLGVVKVHPLYQEPLSDLMPSERINEFWNPKVGNLHEKMSLVHETARKKLSALSRVTGRLWRDLMPRLNKAAAPPIVRPSRSLAGVSPEGLLWYEYSRLNYAVSELEEHAIRAMPAYEREARFKSAFLRQRLEGSARAEALLRMSGAPLKDAHELIVYTISEESRQFNVRPPALGFALSPRDQPNFLNTPVFPLVEGMDWRGNPKGSAAEAGITQVSVAAIDRINKFIALRPWWAYAVPGLEALGRADFSSDVMLDPVGEDFLSKKIEMTLRRIGWPASARQGEAALRALGLVQTARTANPTDESPASEFLWQAPQLANQTVGRDVGMIRDALEEKTGLSLNSSQWEAWESGLTRRMTLIWGPPGTGKSQTLRALIAGAVWDAHRRRVPLRILISSQTYGAVDNVLFGTDELLKDLLTAKPYRLFRLQSDYNEPPARLEQHPNVEAVHVKTTQAPADVIALQTLLQNNEQIVIVGGPSQQVHNLTQATKNKSKLARAAQEANTKKPWFDLVIIDEASQLDVAESTLIISKAAEGASFVLAGDDLQLPPIHAAAPPEKLEQVVGSVYSYVRHHQGVSYKPLQVNYRSSGDLVAFTRHAGYDSGLRAHNPNLRLQVLGTFPQVRPADWPPGLFWTPNWAKLLAPESPAACFLYDDDLASQVNDFEADAVAALIYLLFGRLDEQLAGEQGEDGVFCPATGHSYNATDFWKKVVGVVTPHKAQMARVVSRLEEVFPDHDRNLIAQAVDTVERFQGQQRDVVITSFGLGDPDLIEAEDEFLFNLNRFNVTASRARAKMIVLTTRSLINHVSNNAEVLDHSRLIKYFVERFCNQEEHVNLGYIDSDGLETLCSGVLRNHAATQRDS